MKALIYYGDTHIAEWDSAPMPEVGERITIIDGDKIIACKVINRTWEIKKSRNSASTIQIRAILAIGDLDTL